MRMFTGLVEEMGTVLRQEAGVLTVRTGLLLRPGESVAVDGCCLTVIDAQEGMFSASLMPETLRRTTLGDRRPGDPVNLERPVPAGGRLGGHIVQGHVDGRGRIVARETEGDSVLLTVQAPPAVLRYVVEKGSVAVDGVSLTVVDRTEEAFRVALIPHTLRVTTLGHRRVGDAVNLEADVVAKYVEALVRPYRGEER